MIRKMTKAEQLEYTFNHETAKQIYTNGPYGAIVYLGEVGRQKIVFDLDGGVLTQVTSLGKAVRSSEMEDYEDISNKVFDQAGSDNIVTEEMAQKIELYSYNTWEGEL